MIPNRAIRTDRLDCYDFRVLCCIMSCGDSAFPGYRALKEWCGISDERLWKSLRTLEQKRFIYRYKMGRSVQYRTYLNNSSGEAISGRSIRYTSRIHSPDEVEPIRQTNTINTKLKITLKKSDADALKMGTEENDSEGCPF